MRLLRTIPYLVMAQLLLSSCARDSWEAVLSTPIDTTIQRQVREAIVAKKMQFNGPVTLQIGGTNNTGTTTDATKAKAPVAAAPNAVATETTTKAGTPWYVYAVAGVLLMGAGAYLSRKL